MTARATFAATSRYAVTFEPLLTSSEVAALARVQVATVSAWAREGKLASARTPGRQRRYREADVRALLGLEGSHEH